MPETRTSVPSGATALSPATGLGSRPPEGAPAGGLPPVIAPGHTFGTITDKISAIVLTPKTPRGLVPRLRHRVCARDGAADVGRPTCCS